ncbi:hypothetical protein [Lactobacillus delbrueckii]|nr:hypothetical protein [Lactobacillus delbrueckii]
MWLLSKNQLHLILGVDLIMTGITLVSHHHYFFWPPKRNYESTVIMA